MGLKPFSNADKENQTISFFYFSLSSKGTQNVSHLRSQGLELYGPN